MLMTSSSNDECESTVNRKKSMLLRITSKKMARIDTTKPMRSKRSRSWVLSCDGE